MVRETGYTLCPVSESLGGTSGTVRDWTARDKWLKPSTCDHTGAVRDWTVGANGSNSWLGALLGMHRVASRVQKGLSLQTGFLDKGKGWLEVNPSRWDKPFLSHRSPPLQDVSAAKTPLPGTGTFTSGMKDSPQLMGHDWFNYTNLRDSSNI